MENEEPKSSSSIHIRNIANDLSSDDVFKNFFHLLCIFCNFIIFIKEEPFSDDEDEEEDEEDLEYSDVIDKEFRTMNTIQIDKAVTEINQKIVQSSIKKTNLNNPIKVLVNLIKNIDS